MYELNGIAQITNDGIKKHFKNLEPYKCIFELIWNGLDAKANNINIYLHRTDIEGLEKICIFDDGEGIDLDNLANSFKKFNESNKKNDVEKHGSHGRGRLAFHRLCDDATWFTKWNSKNARIYISANSISKYNGELLNSSEQKEKLKNIKSGTFVELNNIYNDSNFPTNQNLIDSLSNEFSWIKILNPLKNIYLDEKEIPVSEHKLYERSIVIDGIDFLIKAIHWSEKPSSEKSYNYLVNSQNKLIKKDLSKTNNKISFFTSCYAYSEWIDKYNVDQLELENNFDAETKILKKIHSEMTKFLKEIYQNYLRHFVDNEIDKFDQNGYFPLYKGLNVEYANWRKAQTKKALKSIYLADPNIFNQLRSKPLKVLIRLLDKLLVINDDDAIFDVLEGALDLDDDQLKKLANQLKTTTLENIISTIDVLKRREITVHRLRELMDNHFMTVLETPDLQKIIEANTWLFGAQYEIIGAEEDTFTRTAKTLRTKIKDIDLIENSDVEDAEIEGVNRQVDLFLARKKAVFDATGNKIYKCIIVEIKKPSVSLNKKHLNQLTDYAEIISNHPGFSSDKLIFELILIGRKISKNDYLIRSQMDTLKDKSENGLVFSSGKVKCYVKDWYTIFDEFSLSNDYLLDNLQSKLVSFSEVSKSELVTSLQDE